MAHFLRDQYVKSVTLTEDAIREIHQIFCDKTSKNTGELPGEAKVISMVIRFDGRGFKLYKIDDLLNYWRTASKIERIVFSVDSLNSLHSNRTNGSYLELKLDHSDDSQSYFVSSSDDKDWAEASFTAVSECLAKYRSNHKFVRTPWTAFLIQLFGIVVVCIVSLWQSVKLAPNLNFENPVFVGFLVLFFFYLAIFGFASQALLKAINSWFPNVEFFRAKRTLHWFPQIFVGAIAIAVVGAIGTALINLASQLIKISP
ncbi:hypothetical protein [Pseudacidovorax intermedius]|uniref:hypothetical protein n=1 Tax=Pseudacidovorax intermedius TaxID=433924 RepID=UPI0026EDB713|nr:hypothetical protein [Pseudacidovorax intermedius]